VFRRLTAATAAAPQFWGGHLLPANLQIGETDLVPALVALLDLADRTAEVRMTTTTLLPLSHGQSTWCRTRVG
jgi:hypothetical protein